MNSFWLTFIITEAIGVAQAFVSLSNLSPAVKTALENFITAGSNLIVALRAPKGVTP